MLSHNGYYFKEFLGLDTLFDMIKNELPLSVIKEFLSSGIDTTISLEGERALDLAHEQNNQELISLLQNHEKAFLYKNTANHAGHVLGLDGSLNTMLGTFVLDGAGINTALLWLKDFINAYIKDGNIADANEKMYFEQIEEAIKYSIENSSLKNIENLYSNYKKGKLTYIPCCWSDHAVAVVIIGDYLVYSNRGDGSLNAKAGAAIYKIVDQNRITPLWIKQLRFDHPNSHAFMKVLKEVVDLDSPLVTYPFKQQEHGNCAFVNPKSSIEPMMALCELYAANQVSAAHLLEIAENNKARTKYKNFTRFISDREVQNIICSVKKLSASQDKEAEFYGKLINAIIKQHHGHTSRTETRLADNINRALKLLRETSNITNAIVAANPSTFVEFFKHLMATKRFTQALELYNLLGVTVFGDYDKQMVSKLVSEQFVRNVKLTPVSMPLDETSLAAKNVVRPQAYISSQATNKNMSVILSTSQEQHITGTQKIQESLDGMYKMLCRDIGVSWNEKKQGPFTTEAVHAKTLTEMRHKVKEQGEFTKEHEAWFIAHGVTSVKVKP